MVHWVDAGLDYINPLTLVPGPHDTGATHLLVLDRLAVCWVHEMSLIFTLVTASPSLLELPGEIRWQRVHRRGGRFRIGWEDTRPQVRPPGSCDHKLGSRLSSRNLKRWPPLSTCSPCVPVFHTWHILEDRIHNYSILNTLFYLYYLLCTAAYIFKNDLVWLQFIFICFLLLLLFVFLLSIIYFMY